MDYHINESEYRFMDILWDAEPVKSTELVKICNEKLGWKKPTTFTVIRNLSEKEIVKNEQSIVTSLVSREEIQKQESNDFLEKKFKGSLPAFVATFLQDRTLTKKEAEDIQKLINEAMEEK